MQSCSAAAAAAANGDSAAQPVSAATPSEYMPPAAYVYSGPGAGTRSVLSTLHSLRESLLPAVKVASLGTAELLAGGWQPGCLLLVMPGGADLPYCKHLNGKGNKLIREYVEGGGAYLGLCAGAYYACARVEFEPGSRLEVVGDRELAFFPGAAMGCIYRGFDYESEAGAVAAPLRFRCLEAKGGAAECAEADVEAATDLAEGEADGRRGQAAAAGGGSAGSTGGGKAPQRGGPSCSSPGGDSLITGSGAMEPAAGSDRGSGRSQGQGQGQGVPPLEQWEQCVDYVNGGPAFRLLDGSELAPLLLRWQPALHQQGQQQEQQPWLGGPQQGQQEGGQHQGDQRQGQLEGIELLATYPEHGEAAAALLCRIGGQGGRAVLCSSHPELHPSWLGGVPPSAPEEYADGGSSSNGHSRSGSSPASLNGGGGSSSSEDGGQMGCPAPAPAAAVAGESPAARAAFVDSVTNRAAAASALSAELSKDGHVQRLQGVLLEGRSQRLMFWRSLLVAAGLQPWMQAPASAED